MGDRLGTPDVVGIQILFHFNIIYTSVNLSSQKIRDTTTCHILEHKSLYLYRSPIRAGGELNPVSFGDLYRWMFPVLLLASLIKVFTLKLTYSTLQLCTVHNYQHLN